MKVRAGLLLLLPVIALAIYIEGQRYDPEIFDFSKTSGNALAKYFPSTSGNLTRKGPARVFTKENLYEYINGHAEFFISSGFKSLAVAGYGMKGEEADTPAYTVDIFDMGSPSAAFGVMTRESAGSEPEKVGFMGYRNNGGITFINGPYFVKITSFKPGGEISALASDVAKSIGDLKTELPQFALFPESGAMENGRGFIRRDYMGLDFLAEVYEQRYERSGLSFSAFSISPQQGPDRFIESFLSFFKESGAKLTSIDVEGARGWEVHDEYEGTWSLVQTGRDFMGVREIEDDSARAAFLREVVGKSRKQ